MLVEDPEDLRRQFDGELEIDPDRVAASDERSWVGLPLLAAGAPLGALRFSFGRPRKITEEERVFLEALAGQCSLAVERAGLYEREHTTAETLQRSLLPDRLPTLPRLVLRRGTARWPRTWRSAATGTTRSGWPTSGWRWRSATSWARG